MIGGGWGGGLLASGKWGAGAVCLLSLKKGLQGASCLFIAPVSMKKGVWGGEGAGVLYCGK